MGAKLLNCFCWSVQKLHIGRVGSTSSSSSSRADNYNAYHKLAVAVAEVWGSAIYHPDQDSSYKIAVRLFVYNISFRLWLSFDNAM